MGNKNITSNFPSWFCCTKQKNKSSGHISDVCIFAQNITNVGFHGKPLIFFLGPGIHGLFFEFGSVFTKMLAEKIETLVVFMKCTKKMKPPAA